MSVSLETPVASSVANGVTTVFPHAFTVLAAADLVVTGTLAGITTVYALGVNYTVDGLGTGAGSVTFGAAPAAGTVVNRFRVSQLTRNTDYQNNGDLRATTVNLDFDRVWLVLQEHALAQTSGVRAPYPEVISALPNAAARARRALVFDVNGNPGVSVDYYDDHLALVTAQAVAAGLSAAAAAGSAAGAAASAAAAASSRALAEAIVLGNFLQSGAGGVNRTFPAKAREILSAMDFGADNTGAVDASVDITEVFTEGQASNRPVRLGGGFYKLAAAVLLPYHVEADFGQAAIDGSAVGAGNYAITAKNKAGATTLQYPSMWKGLRLDVGATTANGVKIEAPTGQWAVSNFAAETWSIKGGARGLGFGQNTWLCNFRNVFISGQSVIGVDGTMGSNSGESMVFYGGSIAGVVNGGTTGIGLLTDYNAADPGGGTWKFFGTSFTYSDVQIHHRQGLLELHGCHIEASGAQPMVKVEQVVGRQVINMSAHGTEWMNNPASTRTAIIQVTGNAVINIQGGECAAIGNTEGLEFVSVPAAGDTPSINIRGVSFNLFPGISQPIGRICGKTSLVRNGDFETGTLDGWGMDALNFLRNGAFSGGVNGQLGAGGVWPTNMGLQGGLNGLNQPTLTFLESGGRPVMRVAFSGVPTASGITGIYFDSSNGIASAQGDLWKQRCYVRLFNTPSGVNTYSLQISERDGGGGFVGGGSTAFNPSPARALFEQPYTIAGATAASIQPAFQFAYTVGVAVALVLEFDTPSVMLQPMVYKDIIRNDPAGALPTYRVQLAAAGGRTAAKALKLYSTAVESVGVFALVPVKSRDWLVCRGYANITALAAGGAGLKLSWRDAQDVEISNQNVRPTYLAAAGAGYVQHSGVRVAPQGAEKARLYAWLEAFNGTVVLDDIEAWIV